MNRSYSRRSFLGFSAAIVGAAAVPPLATAATIELRRDGDSDSSTPELLRERFGVTEVSRASDRVLVMIQLEGGNDGLHTIVPYQNGDYHDLRRRHAVPDAELSILDDTWGLHAMENTADHWRRGHLAIVHGVGYEPANLSHFTSTDIWHRGTVDPSEPDGWLGRALRALPGASDNPFIGASLNGASPAMRATGLSTLAIRSNDLLAWSPRDRAESPHLHTSFERLSAPVPGEPALVAAARSAHADALAVGARVGPLADRALERRDAAEHAAMGDEALLEALEAGGELGRDLSLTADMITAGLPTRAYHLTQGGYDTHVEQDDHHPVLLRGLDQALAAFWTRLGADADRVTVLIWSEFGRRPRYNGSAGTDHGTSSVALVVGPQVRGGHVGSPAPLRTFDRDDNFVVTTPMGALLSGVATTVLGVPGDIVAKGVTPLAL